MARDWAEFRAKVDREHGRCRVCGAYGADAAHIVPRSRINARDGAESEYNCIPLCRIHHDLYDGHDFDILPYLTRSEQTYAVSLVGIEEARRRLTGER
jgi:predicted restriction endonuclease